MKHIVINGRFSPCHLGHVNLINHALGLADHVIVIVGSHNKSRDIKTPFTSDERKSVLMDIYRLEVENGEICFDVVQDYINDDGRWLSEFLDTVGYYVSDEDEVSLLCHEKDKDFYEEVLPDWSIIPAPPWDTLAVTSTKIREYLLRGFRMSDISLIPKETQEFLGRWVKDNPVEFKRLQEEYLYLNEYNNSWKVAPYEVPFVTVDAVIFYQDSVLLIKRGGTPGKGQYALPGGFVNKYERLDAACTRELREETGIELIGRKMPDQIDYLGSNVFDAPNRSLRGRIITHAYCYQINDENIAEITAGDDASEVFWYKITSNFVKDRYLFFGDHWEILLHFIENSLERDILDECS